MHNHQSKIKPIQKTDLDLESKILSAPKIEKEKNKSTITIRSKKKLFDEKTGQELSETDLNAGKKGISYIRLYQRKPVDLKTGIALNSKEIAQGKKSISYAAFTQRKLVHPITGKKLSKIELEQGIIGISYASFRSHQLVHPKTGKALTENDISQGIEGIRYSLFQSRKLVHPGTGKILTAEEISQGEIGIKLSSFYAKKRNARLKNALKIEKHFTNTPEELGTKNEPDLFKKTKICPFSSPNLDNNPIIIDALEPSFFQEPEEKQRLLSPPRFFQNTWESLELTDTCNLEASDLQNLSTFWRKNSREQKNSFGSASHKPFIIKRG